MSGRTNTSVSVKGFHLAFGHWDGVPTLDGLDLHVRRGDFAAVIGPAGCGKLPSMNLSAGFFNQDQSL
jgi:ABC-type nitrate/sulfonate/bicarbonate transport system ATPase subunit